MTRQRAKELVRQRRLETHAQLHGVLARECQFFLDALEEVEQPAHFAVLYRAVRKRCSDFNLTKRSVLLASTRLILQGHVKRTYRHKNSYYAKANTDLHGL
jgi:hypothetical protein